MGLHFHLIRRSYWYLWFTNLQWDNIIRHTILSTYEMFFFHMEFLYIHSCGIHVLKVDTGFSFSPNSDMISIDNCISLILIKCVSAHWDFAKVEWLRPWESWGPDSASVPNQQPLQRFSTYFHSFLSFCLCTKVQKWIFIHIDWKLYFSDSNEMCFSLLGLCWKVEWLRPWESSGPDSAVPNQQPLQRFSTYFKTDS